jgi:hypothetical protein
MKKILRGISFAAVLALIGVVVGLSTRPSFAAEGASGLYLLGYQSSLMGFIPPPGFYFRNDLYYYNASVGRAILQGRLNTDLNILTLVDAMNFTYVPKFQLPGDGSYGAALLLPVAFANLQANVSIGNQSLSRSGDNGGFAGVSLGAVSYAYQQISGDSGSGATLRSFEGRVFALGPQVGYATVFKKRPFSVSGRYYKEFGAKNRFEGNALFLTVTYKLF